VTFILNEPNQTLDVGQTLITIHIISIRMLESGLQRDNQ